VAKPLWIAGFLGLLALSPQAEAQLKPESGRVAALIGRLDSRDFAEREQAKKALEALGAPALEALRQAARTGTLEARRRAAALVRVIERRAEAAPFLAPARLRLVYKEVPLFEALTDVMLRTGLTIRLHGDTAGLARWKLTVDTGDLPFWDALDRFARAAGLREVDDTPPVGMVAPQRGMSVTIVGGGAGVRAVDVLGRTPRPQPLVLTFQEGKAISLPTHVTGPIRLRALPPTVAAPVDKAGEVSLRLDVTAAPPVGCREVLGVRLTRALDDQGQRLQGRLVLPPADPVPAAGRGMVIINGRVITPPDERPKGPSRQLSLAFAAGAKPSKALKELSGSLVALMESGPEILVTVPKVVGAQGKKFTGPQGTWMQIAEITRDGEGNVTLRVEVASAPHNLDDGSRPPEPAMNIIVNGRRLGEPQRLLSDRNFSLFDGAGRPLQVTRASYTGKHTATSQEYELTFRRATPAGMTGEAVRFVYRDRRTAVLEVPFTLRDVPLP
jgi:hypothetical protein